MYTIKRKPNSTQWLILSPSGNPLPAMVGSSEPRLFAFAWAAANFCLYWGIGPYCMPELDPNWSHP